MSESLITINGVLLSEGQSLSVRVAIESFIIQLKIDGLGNDDRGNQITKSYLERLGEIQELIHEKTP